MSTSREGGKPPQCNRPHALQSAQVRLVAQQETKKNGWSDDTRCVIDEWILLEYAATFLPVNQAALVEAVSKGTIEMPQEIMSAICQDPIAAKPEIQPKQQEELPRIAAFTSLSEIHRATERSLAAWDIGKLAEECLCRSIERVRGRV